MMQKYTTEEALRLSFKDWRERSVTAQAKEGAHVTITLTQTFNVPANYAKEVS